MIDNLMNFNNHWHKEEILKFCSNWTVVDVDITTVVIINIQKDIIVFFFVKWEIISLLFMFSCLVIEICTHKTCTQICTNMFNCPIDIELCT